jgi:hypothetical protein
MTLQTGHPRPVASNIKQAFNKSIYKGSQEITRKLPGNFPTNAMD